VNVDRHSDRVRLIADGLVDRLANPPHCVRGEFRSSPPVEALRRANQANGALLDEVKKRNAPIRVRAGHCNDESKIRLDHTMRCRNVALLDPLCQPDLLDRCQDAMPADLTYVLRKRVRAHGGLIRSRSFLGHAATVGAPMGSAQGDWPGEGRQITSPYPPT